MVPEPALLRTFSAMMLSCKTGNAYHVVCHCANDTCNMCGVPCYAVVKRVRTLVHSVMAETTIDTSQVLMIIVDSGVNQRNDNRSLA